MMGFMFTTIMMPIIIVVAVLLPIKLSQKRAAMQRLQTASSWAAANRCLYMPQNPAMVNYFRGRPFTAGMSAGISDFIEGKTPQGRMFCSFLYSYVVSDGRASETILIAATAIRLSAPLPQLSVTVKTFGDKVAHFFGGQDIELESDDFNKIFRVQSSNEAFAYGVLTPQAMAWLLNVPPGLAPFAIYGPDLICWHPGTVDYLRLGAQLTAMEVFADAIPQGVYEQFTLPPMAQYWWTPGVTTRPGVLQYSQAPVPRR